MHTAVKCPVWLVDTDTGMFLDVNPSALEVFGYSREEILRLSIFDIIDPGERLRFSSAWVTWIEKWGDGGTWGVRMKNGTRFSMTLRFHATHFGNGLAFVLFPTSLEQHPTCTVVNAIRISSNVKSASQARKKAATNSNLN